MYWNIKELQAPELSDWLENESDGAFRVIDVREPSEVRSGSVPGAEHIPLATVPVRFQEFDRDETLVFVCRSGARSAQACMFLQQQGFDKVYNLSGGMQAWAANGLPAPLPQAV